MWKETGWQRSVCKYRVARRFRQRHVRNAIFKSMRNVTGSQWRSKRIGVIRSHFLTPLSRRAAAFCTRCRRSRDVFNCSARRELQLSIWETTKAWMSWARADWKRNFLIWERRLKSKNALLPDDQFLIKYHAKTLQWRNRLNLSIADSKRITGRFRSKLREHHHDFCLRLIILHPTKHTSYSRFSNIQFSRPTGRESATLVRTISRDPKG